MATTFGRKYKEYREAFRIPSVEVPAEDPTGQTDRIYTFESKTGYFWKFNIDEALRRYPDEHPYDVFEREMYMAGAVAAQLCDEKSPVVQAHLDVVTHLMCLERIEF